MNDSYVEDNILLTFFAFTFVVLYYNFVLKLNFLVIILFKMHFCNISLKLLCKSQ